MFLATPPECSSRISLFPLKNKNSPRRPIACEGPACCEMPGRKPLEVDVERGRQMQGGNRTVGLLPGAPRWRACPERMQWRNK